MPKTKKISSTLLLAILLFTTIMAPAAFAENKQPSGMIDYILVEMEDGAVVRIGIDEYIELFTFGGGPLYDFLAGEKGYLQVYGIGSGEKYISIDTYAESFAYYDDVTEALNAAAAIEDSIVETFMEVEIDEETGEIGLVPIGGQHGPSIKAIFIQRGLPNFGFVITEVEGIEDAAKFSVGYYIKAAGQPTLRETEIVRIGEEAGTIHYVPNEEPYNKVNIKIYNEAEELLYTFVDVVLSVGETVNANSITTQQVYYLYITD